MPGKVPGGVPEILDAPREHSQQIQVKEIRRLRALRSINPNVREEEIEHFQRQLEAVSRVLASAQRRLDALRVVVTTESPVHKDCRITRVVMPAAGGFRNIPVSVQDNDGLQLSLECAVSGSNMSRETINCTVMFADIAGSTDIYGEYGNAAAKSAIVACVELMAEITRQYKGIVIKTIGDEIMCRFDSATAALDAACRIQEAVNIPFGDMNIVMQVKIGLHEGEAILENNDVFGAAANVAASMAAIAKARQIITTQDTYDLLDPRLQDRSREFDVTAVKGKAGKITIYEIIWNVDDDVTCMAVSPPATEVDTSITLIYKGDSISVHSDQVPFVIGRGAASDLTAEAPLASRSHAKIDYSRGKFVLVDQSTNGTYVKLGDGNEVYLRREELPLRSRGSISLGEKVTEGSPLLVHFMIG